MDTTFNFLTANLKHVPLINLTQKDISNIAIVSS